MLRKQCASDVLPNLIVHKVDLSPHLQLETLL